MNKRKRKKGKYCNLINIVTCISLFQIIAGNSNVTIKKFINGQNEEFKENFIGVYPSNCIVVQFINYYKVIKDRKCCYPLAIFNTDRSN